MIVQQILEFSRLLWNERCTIVNNKKEFTYEGRIRKKYNHLCIFLQRHNDLVPQHKQHLIEKEPSLFEQQPFPNIKMEKTPRHCVRPHTHSTKRKNNPTFS